MIEYPALRIFCFPKFINSESMNYFKIKPIPGYLIFYLAVVALSLFSFAGYSQGRPIEKAVQQKKCLIPVLIGDYIHIYVPQGITRHGSPTTIVL